MIQHHAPCQLLRLIRRPPALALGLVQAPCGVRPHLLGRPVRRRRGKVVPHALQAAAVAGVPRHPAPGVEQPFEGGFTEAILASVRADGRVQGGHLITAASCKWSQNCAARETPMQGKGTRRDRVLQHT